MHHSGRKGAETECRLRAASKEELRQFPFRGSLIAATLVVFVVAVATFICRVRTQAQAVAEIRGLGGHVTYEPNWLGLCLPESIEKHLGENACGYVSAVYLRHRIVKRRMTTPSDAELGQAVDAISRLPYVTQLSLHTLNLHDDDLARLAPLRDRIEDLTINELFHRDFRADGLRHLSGWTELRRLTILSTGLNDSVDLEPLASLPNLTTFTLGTDALDESVFAGLSKIDSLRALGFFCCRFKGEHLRYLKRLPNLNALSLHNTHAEAEYPSYIMDESGVLQPNSEPIFRFKRSHGFWPGHRGGFPAKRYKKWLKKILPRVQVFEMFSS